MEKGYNTLVFKRDDEYISKEAQRLFISFNDCKIGDIIIGLRTFTAESLIQLAEIILCMPDKELIYSIRNGYLKLIFYSNKQTFVVKNVINKIGIEEYAFVIL